jgi:hypothetical protein
MEKYGIYIEDNKIKLKTISININDNLKKRHLVFSFSYVQSYSLFKNHILLINLLILFKYLLVSFLLIAFVSMLKNKFKNFLISNVLQN